MTRFIFLTTVLAAIGSTAWFIDFQSAAVEPAPASHAPSEEICAPGIVEGATESIALRPELSGVVVERLVAVGDWVQSGQTLVRFDDRSARLELAEAQAQLALSQARLERILNGARNHERDEARALEGAAESRLSQAITALGRIEQLERKNALPAQEADDARSKVETLRAELAASRARLALLEAPAREDEVRLARAQVSAAEASVGLAQVMLEKRLIRAPCDARVLDIDAELGELIGPADQNPVVVLADTRQLRVRAFIEELDAPHTPIGAATTITADGLPGETFHGVITSISPRMAAKEFFTNRPNEMYDAKTREAIVEVQEGSGLIVGLRVDLRIDSTQATMLSAEGRSLR
ncbi:Multidrug resistance protein MdtN [Pseudobythopirellula maris]|uniref:Multidrug resistance protein MdtN n=1 Tax=Pseudobythopirellula maris TaxID=2527991 RepID=A0A5C5ZQI6_9BACT|nr:HlyD family efflux transporter periplasmic adaptor subunit [Pseudobythopirellula maris]TWT89719.1 Multidrug resistance protein MdtN [Pseudobythopirellula maris]